jgi:hypothetical protein
MHFLLPLLWGIRLLLLDSDFLGRLQAGRRRRIYICHWTSTRQGKYPTEQFQVAPSVVLMTCCYSAPQSYIVGNKELKWNWGKRNTHRPSRHRQGVTDVVHFPLNIADMRLKEISGRFHPGCRVAEYPHAFVQMRFVSASFLPELICLGLSSNKQYSGCETT